MWDAIERTLSDKMWEESAAGVLDLRES